MSLFQNQFSAIVQVQESATVQKRSRPDGSEYFLGKLRVRVPNNPDKPRTEGESPKPDMCFIDIVVWDGIARSPKFTEWFVEGAVIVVSNVRLVLNEWKAEDGTNRQRHELHADRNSHITPMALFKSPGGTGTPTTSAASTAPVAPTTESELQSDAIPF